MKQHSCLTNPCMPQFLVYCMSHSRHILQNPAKPVEQPCYAYRCIYKISVSRYIMIYSHLQNLAEKVQLISIDHYSGTGIYQISFIGGYSCYINGIHQLEVPYANAGISSGVTLLIPMVQSWHFEKW